MSATPWSFGDRVTHADRPEWGVGQITAVQPIMVEGRPTQRLTIRFERAGIKTLASALANIRKADAAPVQAEVEAPSAEAQKASDAELAKKLTSLPESVVDPFIPLAKRLETTLGLYRFSDKGGSLLDWAAMQTGLADPLPIVRTLSTESLQSEHLCAGLPVLVTGAAGVLGAKVHPPDGSPYGEEMALIVEPAEERSRLKVELA